MSPTEAADRLDLILRVLRHGPRLDEDPGAFARHIARALDEIADDLRASAAGAADLADAPDWLLALPRPPK